MHFENSLSFARKADRHDPLRQFRSQFFFPSVNRKKAIYLAGNSLGLQPKSTKRIVDEELSDWADLGVEGHFHAKRPWLHYHRFSKNTLAKLVGAKPYEVVAMNHLTVNLHLMMTTFYRPGGGRFKIITEAGAFSSDQYAVESQIKLHGLSPAEALVEISPRAGEHVLRTEDILTAIQQHKGELSLVLFGAVQYYTGQFFDIEKITRAGQNAGAMVGFDLAHAIGNVPLQLHQAGVDFAVWCGYKYLNAGPGGVAGAFVHEKHGDHVELQRLAGWWGHDDKERFQMRKGFQPMRGVDGWQVSNFPVLSGAAQLASLEIFKEAGIIKLRKKSLLLTGFLEFLLLSIEGREKKFAIITPTDPVARGCQLSLLIKKDGRKIFDRITKAGVVADWREPDVIRVAPVPLYNTFEDVYRFVEIFRHALA